MAQKFKTDEIIIGVVGLGLMGSSIIVSLLIAGHQVKAIAPIHEDMNRGASRIKDELLQCDKSGVLSKPIDAYLSQLIISEEYSVLYDCMLVIECVIETMEIKETVYNKILAVVGNDTIIASNTSAIPISTLQKGILFPERFLGIHWAEPAFATRFLEITCGDQTNPLIAEWVFELAHSWGKEPTLLRKDIRGFITNRLMYSVYREALSLVEHGDATLEDVDKAFRYDAGSWMTLMGIFRRMDFIGLKDYAAIIDTVFPKLDNSDNVPRIMQKLMSVNARGIHNLKGLYNYTEEEAKQWQKAFALFNQEIFHLAARYPSDIIGDKRNLI